MKQLLIYFFLFVLLKSDVIPFASIGQKAITVNFFEQSSTKNSVSTSKQKAFQILKEKCNSCHKKKNPFKVFSLKNMDKHAPKIYKQVFVYRRMPKGNEVTLTDKEYQLLKSWLSSLNSVKM